MSEKPILFSGPMVRALLGGAKTQTRRIVKPQPKLIHAMHADASLTTERIFRSGDQRIHCPYGTVGTRLWVRETFCVEKGGTVHYRADGYQYEDDPNSGWKPSIFMPRSLSRITLEITEVRVQRIADISQSDCQAEGCPGGPDRDPTPRQQFMALWDLINGKKAPWAANPIVFAVSFKLVNPNRLE